MSTMNTRSTRGSKSEDSVFVSITTEEVEAIVQRAVVAAVKEVQELVNVKLDEVRQKMQDYDERLKKLEGITVEFQEFGERLWKLEQIIDDKELTSQVATEVSKSLSTELNAARAESRESLLSSNDNEQYNRMNNLRIHGIQPEKDCRNLAVDFLKKVLHVPDIEEKDIEAAHSAFPTQQSSATSTQARRPVILVRFRRREHRDKVIRARRVLKGSKYAVSEDLTLLNVKTMSRVKNSEHAQNVWSCNGKIHAMLKTGKKVVVRPFQSLEELL